LAQGVQPLLSNRDNPSRTISSLVKSLIPDIETGPEETLDGLLAEAELLVLRLQSIFDKNQHSLTLLAISSVVFASGVWMVRHGILTRAGNPLYGFYQFFGVLVLALGGLFLFYSIVTWSSNYKRLVLSRRLLKEGLSVIRASKSFLQSGSVKTEDSSRQSEAGPYSEEPGIL